MYSAERNEDFKEKYGDSGSGNKTYFRFADLQDADQTVAFDVDCYWWDGTLVVQDYDLFIYNKETDFWDEVVNKTVQNTMWGEYGEELVTNAIEDRGYWVEEVKS